MSAQLSKPKAGETRRDSEHFAYATVEALSEHIAVLDELGAIVAVNRAWREFAVANSGSQAGLGPGANYFAVCERATSEGRGDAARFAAGLRAVIGRELNEFSHEYTCHSPTQQRWFVARVTRFKLDGEIRAVVAHTDITERKLTEQRLTHSEEQLRSIFEASRDGILVEQDERIVYINSSYARLFGYEHPGELIGKPISTIVSPGDKGRMLEYGRQRLRGEHAPAVYEFKGKRRDGTLIDLEVSVSTHAVAGKTYITSLIRDITERKAAEKALRRSESRCRLLLEQASDGIHTYDLRGEFIETNSKLCEMLGYTREELLRLNVTDLVPKDDLVADPIRFDELRAGQTLLNERRLRRKDGTLIPVEISGKMIEDGVLQSIIRDISGRKRAEEELRTAYDELERRVGERTTDLARANEMLKAEIAERMRAEEARKALIMRLVAAQEEERRRISRELHDQLGQRMTALMMGLKTLSAQSHEHDLTLSNLLKLQDLAGELTRELHALAWDLRPPALDDLGLQTALYNYVEEWAEQTHIAVDFHCTGTDGGRMPLEVEITIYRIAQEALTNLLKHSGADRVSVVLERLGDEVVAVIEDNGRGFDAEALLKPSGRGRKLGLLGMCERAEMIGGTLNVESSPGAGTSVFVRIPLQPDGSLWRGPDE